LSWKNVNLLNARCNGSNVVAESTLLSTATPQTKIVSSAWDRAGIRDRVKVILGGVFVTESYAQEIGVEGYAADASSSAKMT
jgi:5-methyltetrahydrofolate--homocysteine methyltransferase